MQNFDYQTPTRLIFGSNEAVRKKDSAELRKRKCLGL